MKPGHMLVFISLEYDGSSPSRSEVVPCTRNTTIIPYLAHQRFYVIDRRLVDTLGYWGIVMINGERRLIDGSVPTHVDRLPRDAMEITGDLAEDILHSQDGDHSWAGKHACRVVALLDARSSRRP